MARSPGSPLPNSWYTITTIPRTEFSRILRTKSLPETIAASLNAAELSSSRSRNALHKNARRAYPFWKVCEGCQSLFPTMTKEQATRNRFCGPACRAKALATARLASRKPPSERPGMVAITCAVCGTECFRPRSHVRRVAQPTCSKRCNGVLRGREWATHAHKSRAAWTAASLASYREKMTGANNPAWKGGVTLKRAKGNYIGPRYTRCPPDLLPMARKDGYVMEHRLVMARHLGRTLARSEIVHHMNHDPRDNRIENLMLFASNAEHKRYEGRKRP